MAVAHMASYQHFISKISMVHVPRCTAACRTWDGRLAGRSLSVSGSVSGLGDFQVPPIRSRSDARVPSAAGPAPIRVRVRPSHSDLRSACHPASLAGPSSAVGAGVRASWVGWLARRSELEACRPDRWHVDRWRPKRRSALSPHLPGPTHLVLFRLSGSDPRPSMPPRCPAGKPCQCQPGAFPYFRREPQTLLFGVHIENNKNFIMMRLTLQT